MTTRVRGLGRPQHPQPLFEVDLGMRPELHAGGEVGAGDELRTERERRIGQHAAQDLFGLRRTTRHPLEDAVEQLGVDARGTDLRRHEREPARDGGRLSSFVDVPSPAEDQIDRAIPALRGQVGTRSRWRDVALRGVPLRGGDEQLRLGACVGGPQAVPQQVTEEVVEPIAIGPARHRDARTWSRPPARAGTSRRRRPRRRPRRGLG